MLKVHAESSIFSENSTKKEIYDQVLEQAIALFEGQRNWVWYALPPPPLAFDTTTLIPADLPMTIATYRTQRLFSTTRYILSLYRRRR